VARIERSYDYGRDTAQIDMGDELRSIIGQRIEAHERSLQTIIGASEVGTPCIRKLGLKLNQTPPVPEQVDGDDQWRATVGVAVHDWLAKMLEADNARLQAEADAWTDADTLCHPWCLLAESDRPGHLDRWLVETHTPVGTIYEQEVPGTLDVYDRWTHTLVDWKIPGPTAIKRYRQTKDPGPEYKTQIQLYGRGLKRKSDEDVKWVGIMFLPSNGELKGSYYWETEFDPEVGKEALRRAREIYRLVQDEGPEIYRKLKTTNDHCVHCPFFEPDTRDPLHCPGDPSLTADMADSFSDLLPHGAPDS
jgi:hypothetical protein